MDDAQKHQLHVEDVLYLVRILGQVDQLLEIGRIVLLTFAGHIQGGYSDLHENSDGSKLKLDPGHSGPKGRVLLPFVIISTQKRMI